MAQVIILSRPGYNWNDPDHSHLIFHSSDNSPKVALKGSYVFTSMAVGASNNATVAHNLGFVPSIDAMYKDPRDGSFHPAGSVDGNCRIHADATNLYIFMFNPTGAVNSISVYYKIGYEGST